MFFSIARCNTPPWETSTQWISIDNARTKASSSSGTLLGYSRAFFQAMLVISYASNAGACISTPSIREAASEALGSLKANAASTEASTTLSGIPGFPDHPHCFISSFEAQTLYVLINLFNRITMRGHRLLQDGHQFPLQRAVVLFGSRPKMFNSFFRNVFDGQTDRHALSNACLEPS